MYGIPAGHRQVVNYRIVELSFTDKPSELHCFGYEGCGRNDWVWSTAIQTDTIKLVPELMDSKSYTFETSSGSCYVVNAYNEEDITYPSKESLLTWFKADSLRILTEQEWESI